MTDLPFLRADAASNRPKSSDARPFVLYGAVATATVGGLLLGRVAVPDTADFHGKLLLLLRFMATMKLAGVIAAAILTHWRLRRPIAPGFALGYGAALVLMASATGLIWSLAHLAVAAGLFHLGLLLFLVLAWRDEGALPTRRSLAPRRR